MHLPIGTLIWAALGVIFVLAAWNPPRITKQPARPSVPWLKKLRAHLRGHDLFIDYRSPNGLSGPPPHSRDGCVGTYSSQNPYFTAYCYRLKSMRRFEFARIVSIVDSKGKICPAEVYFARFKLAPKKAPALKAAPQPSPMPYPLPPPPVIVAAAKRPVREIETLRRRQTVH